MQLVRFDSNDDAARPGVLLRDDDAIVDVRTAGGALDVGVPASMRALLDHPRWRETLDLVVGYALESGVGLLDRADVRLRAPIANPQKIVCVGLNYVEHVEEGGQERPENPVLFSKYATAITGPGDDIAWDPDLTEQVDFEVELAMVVGETARRVDEDEARDHVAGYTVANDVSARDLQFSDDQWTRGKSLDTFCPLGPAIVTEDELGDPEDLDLWTDVDGERLQESNTGNLIYDLDTILSFCSDAFTLHPGDLILTGTPPGVGVFREPPVLLEDGDQVTVGVEGIGELQNHCRYD